MRILLATGDALLSIEPDQGVIVQAEGLGQRSPSCLATDPWTPGRAWCGTTNGELLRSDDGGTSWRAAGLVGERVTAVAASRAERDVVWVGTEPSAILRSSDRGESWRRTEGLSDLPSSSGWSFPPRPETHHVRWIACHPAEPGRLWVAIEAGALVTTTDGGATWRDRVPGGPYDTHELATHPEGPCTLRVAAGDGYFESEDCGATWRSPERGLEVGYLRSVAVDPGDPEVVVVSAASAARSAYVAGRSDGRLYRRTGGGGWKRVVDGWSDPPDTIAPLLVAGSEPGQLWAADERGLRLSEDGGRCWERVARFAQRPRSLSAIALTSEPSAPG